MITDFGGSERICRNVYFRTAYAVLASLGAYSVYMDHGLFAWACTAIGFGGVLAAIKLGPQKLAVLHRRLPLVFWTFIALFYLGVNLVAGFSTSSSLVGAAVLMLWALFDQIRVHRRQDSVPR